MTETLDQEKAFKNAVSSKNLSEALDLVLLGFDVNSFDQLLIKSCLEQNNSKILKKLLSNKEISPSVLYPSKGVPLVNAFGRGRTGLVRQVIKCEHVRNQVPLKEWALMLIGIAPQKTGQNLAKMVFLDLMKHGQLEEVVWLAKEKFPNFKCLKNFFEDLPEKEQENAKNYLVARHQNLQANPVWLDAVEFAADNEYLKIHMDRFRLSRSIQDIASLKEKRPSPKL